MVSFWVPLGQPYTLTSAFRLCCGPPQLPATLPPLETAKLLTPFSASFPTVAVSLAILTINSHLGQNINRPLPTHSIRPTIDSNIYWIFSELIT